MNTPVGATSDNPTPSGRMISNTRFAAETRLSYVKYDEASTKQDAALREAFTDTIDKVEALLPAGREKSLVLTKLEEAFMWTGKSIRNGQIGRTQPSSETKV